MTLPNPGQQFFSIGEVCTLTDLKPHVLRYWESQFRFLSPAKNRSGNRVYKAREVELIMLVKQLLYTEKFTIEGARQRLDQYRKSGELRQVSRDAMRAETVDEVRRGLDDVLTVLAGKEPAPRREFEPQAPVAAVKTSPKLVRDSVSKEPPTPTPAVAAPAALAPAVRADAKPEPQVAPSSPPAARDDGDQLSFA
jgi:DNA-binding transcriptional MerR regulator